MTQPLLARPARPSSPRRAAPPGAPLRRLALVAALILPVHAAAIEVGDAVGDRQLPTLAGSRAHLVEAGVVNVLVFVRPGHGHCLDALRELAGREGKQPGARWAAVVPGDSPLAETRTLIAGTGIKMPVLLDRGDEIYGLLALKLHPTVVVIDRAGRLAALEPFREINYADRLVGRIRFTLGEIGEAQLAEIIEPPRSDTHSDQGLARSSLQFARKLVELGQLDQALALVERSLATAPGAPAHALRGEILARQGRCGDAARAFDAALQLEPGNAQAAAGKARCAKGK